MQLKHALIRKLALKVWRPRWIAAFAVVLIGIFTFHKFQLLDSPDFKVFYTAGKFALSAPEKIYKESPDRFLYPPVAALLFSPFAIPELAASKILWYCFSLVCLFFLAGGTWPEVLAFLFLSRYFIMNLRYGQINILILLMMYFSYHGSRAPRNPRQFGSGLWLAFATMLKIFPATQGAGLLIRKNWRAILASALGLAFLLILPFLAWGWDTALELYKEFPAALADKGIPTNSHNQSFLVLLLRFFHVDRFYAFPYDYVNWRITLVPLWILKLIAIILGSMLTIAAWIKAARRNNPLDDLSAAAFSILFLSHIVWKPYFIFLLPPLTQCMVKTSKSHQTLVGLFLLFGPFVSSDLFGKYSIFAESACIHLAAAMILFLAWLRLPQAMPQTP